MTSGPQTRTGRILIPRQAPATAEAASSAQAEATGAAQVPLPPEPSGLDIRQHLDGPGALLAGLANVIMQLSWAPVGYGVLESRVTGGQLTRHPLKRARTTFTYLAVALLGTEDERRRYRDAVDTAHRQVRSTPASPVRYNAFRSDLQLWVAACMYQGWVDVHTRLHGPMGPGLADAVQRHAARFGTTLQVREEAWPADQAAFEDYWQTALRQVSIAPPVRDYLLGIMTLRALPFPFRHGPSRPLVFWTTGFLPPALRAQLGLTWTDDDEARFARWLRRLGAVLRRLPRTVRLFPLNLMMSDLRWRIRLGRRLV